MRIELGGHVINIDPPPPPPPDPPADHPIPISTNGNVDIKHYKDLGYTHFDVICIGAGGGAGGGVGDGAGSVPNGASKSWPGAGGGGGLHRVKGLLSSLPDTVAVVIGSGGMHGFWHVNNPAGTTDGDDGGYSSFNNPLCVASGGKGGKRVQVVAMNAYSYADGGQGGVGGSIVAGGGGLGGVACVPKTPGEASDGSDHPGTWGSDGTWDGTIGKGGGGGAGGVGERSPAGVYFTAGEGTHSGDGSWNPSDTTVTTPGYPPKDEPPGPFFQVIGAAGAGGKTTPLNADTAFYGQGGWGSDAGQSSEDGIGANGQQGRVVILLTAS